MDKSYQFSENSILKQKLHSRDVPYCVNLVRIVHFDTYKNNYG